jgi:hypothetical protein
MTLTTLLVAAAATLCLTLPAAALDGVQITNAYARASAASGAVFLVIENHQADDDRLIAVSADAVAAKVELHTHKEDANGVMQMMAVSDGLLVPGEGSHALARGGDHVMLMGLKGPLNTGDVISLTLTFEKAGVVTVEVPVDNDRKPDAMGGAMGHMGHDMTPKTD